MTANDHPQPDASPRSTVVRIAALLPGCLVGILAAVALILGGVSLYASSRQDDDGFISTGAHGLSASSYAIVGDELDVDLDGVTWAVDGDAARITAESTTGRPVFVGIAPTADVRDYLGNVGHARIRDFSGDPFRADYVQRAGSRRPARPSRQIFWSASSAGAGRQAVTWPVQDGSWSVVVMNEDGSPAVGADVRAGVKVPGLAEIAWIATGVGVLGLAFAAALIAMGARFTSRPPRDERPLAPRPLDG